MQNQFLIQIKLKDSRKQETAVLAQDQLKDSQLLMDAAAKQLDAELKQITAIADSL